MERTFYSNGKLLLTGEYVVLNGAEALAVPTKFGQYLKVTENNSNEIKWTSFDNDASIWFNDVISFDEIVHNVSKSSNEIKKKLITILHFAYQQNPNFIKNTSGYTIETTLTFPKLWGLGTSSTLLNNIAQWLQIDAFKLLNDSFGGSGYDIACAKSNQPILYQLLDNQPIYKEVNFNPYFTNSIYFLYLNKKQNSASAISSYINQQHKGIKNIAKINEITNEIIHCQSIQKFALFIEKLEATMSVVLERQTIKELLFPDFKGVIKSLGAWGGDFVMIVSKENPTDYFEEKGYKTLLTYSQMVL